ncbi:MAG: efflux RND transporter periplasmic adaptor subunit [Candidatus Zixiibacteriota bacterium]
MEESNAHNADLSALKINREERSGPPGAWKKWLHLLWLLVPVILYFGYQAAIKKVTPSLKVKVDTVRYITGSTASSELVATGYVVAQIKAAVSSKATGRLQKINVEEGDTLLKGDIIAELEGDDILADLDLMKAYLKQARADSVATSLNYNRKKTLLDQALISNEEFETATAYYVRALADVEAKMASVRAVEVALENTIIRAPFDGTVLTKNADIGEMVAPMAASASSRGAVVQMADMSSLEVEADVSESNINKVVIGQPCEIFLDAYPNDKYHGYVKKIVPTADRARATVMTKIAFLKKDERVIPEMSARVNFLQKASVSVSDKIDSVLAVDSDAIATRDGNKKIFIITSDGTIVEKSVTIGRKLGEVTEIISGAMVGERAVKSPPGGLKTGDKIEIIN